jgi:hypothetical protein
MGESEHVVAQHLLVYHHFPLSTLHESFLLGYTPFSNKTKIILSWFYIPLYPSVGHIPNISANLMVISPISTTFHHFPPLSTIQMAIQPYKSWNIRIIFRVSLEPSVGAPTITCMPRKPSGRGRSRPLAWRIDYFSIFFGVVYRVCTCTVIIYYTFIYIYIIYYTYWYDWVRYIYIV